MVLIANLTFSVIHKRAREAEQFTTLVLSMAGANLVSYVCFQTILRTGSLTAAERDLGIVQLDIFGAGQGRYFWKKRKITLNGPKRHCFRTKKTYPDDSS